MLIRWKPRRGEFSSPATRIVRIGALAGMLVLAIGPVAPPAGASGDGPAKVRGFVSAGLLRAWCARDTALDVEGCQSYLRAVFDTLNAVDALPGTVPIAATAARCVPERIAVAQLRRAFLRHMGEHPEQVGHQAAAVLLETVRERYAC